MLKERLTHRALNLQYFKTIGLSVGIIFPSCIISLGQRCRPF